MNGSHTVSCVISGFRHVVNEAFFVWDVTDGSGESVGPKTPVTNNQRSVSHKSEDLNTVRVQLMSNFSVLMESVCWGTGCSVVCALWHMRVTCTSQQNRRENFSNANVKGKVVQTVAVNLKRVGEYGSKASCLPKGQIRLTLIRQFGSGVPRLDTVPSRNIRHCACLVWQSFCAKCDWNRARSSG